MKNGPQLHCIYMPLIPSWKMIFNASLINQIHIFEYAFKNYFLVFLMSMNTRKALITWKAYHLICPNTVYIHVFERLMQYIPIFDLNSAGLFNWFLLLNVLHNYISNSTHLLTPLVLCIFPNNIFPVIILSHESYSYPFYRTQWKSLAVHFSEIDVAAWVTFFTNM